MIKYRLDITLLEDLHTGSGTGMGQYDAILARDRLDRPVIASSHWQGIWADNLRQTLKFLDEAAKTQRQAEIDRLFGRRNDLTGALIATALYAADDNLSTLPWSSTSREEYSRAPKENTLRTQEYIAAGSRFSADVWLTDPELADTLKLACKLTDRLGAQRQSGGGLIEAKLLPITDEAAAKSPAEKLCKRLRLLLKACDPICLPKTGVPGNIIASDCYVRGQTLKGALVAWLLSQGHGEMADGLQKSAGTIDNAYPLPDQIDFSGVQLGQLQVVPVPLHYKVPKPAGARNSHWPWWAEPSASNTQYVDQLKTNGEKLKRPADGAFLCSADAGQHWQAYTSSLSQRMRNNLTSNDLFSQEEIPEHTYFLSDIELLDDPGLWTALLPLLQGFACLRVGRGGAPLTVADWQEAPDLKHSHTPPQADTLLLTLTSDLMAYDPYLRMYENLSAELVCELAGYTAHELDVSKWAVKAFTDHLTIYGFNASMGLPSSALKAIRRGSAIELSGPGVAALRQKLEQRSALGERTELGFGRFLLDFHPCITPVDAQEPDEVLPVCRPEELAAATEVAFNYLRSQKPDTHDWPKLSQWQILRLLVTSTNDDPINALNKENGRLQRKDPEKKKTIWLKMLEDKKNWLDWLMEQLQTYSNDPAAQRDFYKVLLDKIRLHLKTQGEGHDR